MFLWSAIVFGLTGSLHCVGMCGPIALALPVGGVSPARKVLLILLYNLGRSLMYALLGLAAGLTGAGIVLAGYQQLLSILAGILLLLSVFFPIYRTIPLLSPVFRRLRNTMSDLFGKKDKKDLFVLGLLNGLLPCGFVYMALAVALASGSMFQGAAFMFLFGIGTSPLMMTMPFAGSFIGEGLRHRFRRAAPVIVGVMGIVLLLRGLNLGIPYLSPRFDQGKTPACHQVSTADHSIEPILCTGHDSQATR